MAKTKEQKRTEAKTRRLADLNAYRDSYLREWGELQDLMTRSAGSFGPILGLTASEHKECAIAGKLRSVTGLKRSMEIAAKDAGVDLHGNHS